MGQRVIIPLRVGFLLLFVLAAIPALRGQYRLDNAFPHLTFSSPVDIQNARDGTNRLFVVEQGGRIKVFQNSSGTLSAKTFLDITGKVVYGGEQGLLGLAFHPAYSANGYFYVNYTAPAPVLHTVIARYRVSVSDPDAADPGSETLLLTYDQPYTNHNGGQLAFGNDGYLYIAAGDGGSAGDPRANGQNRSTLLGKILRIDVDRTAGSLPYAIPHDNPFVGNSAGYREEIFAYGFRNPWRFSVDFPTGRIWAGDVGQGSREEVDIVRNGGNYGWNRMEGSLGYPTPSLVDTAGLGVTLPLWEYAHTASAGYCITGGYVYRGSALPALAGRYVCADFVSGNIWSLAYDGVNPPADTLLLKTALGVSSFGVDEQGELYLSDLAGGGIYRFADVTAHTGADDGVPAQLRLEQNYPNPFNPSTVIDYQLPAPAFVTLTVFNLLGQEVATLVRGREPAGPHSVRFPGAGLPAGVYLYSLKTGELIETRRMVLLR